MTIITSTNLKLDTPCMGVPSNVYYTLGKYIFGFLSSSFFFKLLMLYIILENECFFIACTSIAFSLLSTCHISQVVNRWRVCK